MYKQCRILNKNTNKIFNGQIDTEFEGKNFYELVEIPDDEKNYIWQDGEIKEYTLSKISTKSDSLLQAENAYIDFCKSLGFEGKASTEEVKAKSEELYNSAQTIDDKFNAIKIPLTALGLINEISQQGGNWESIGE